MKPKIARYIEGGHGTMFSRGDGDRRKREKWQMAKA